MSEPWLIMIGFTVIGAMLLTAALGFVLASVVVAMPAFYLLHCCGESWRGSALLCAVLTLWGVFFAFLGIAQFTTAFYYYTPDNQFGFGPWYPLLGAPLVAMSALILAALVRRWGRLSAKRFYALLVFLVPLTVTMAVHMLAPSFPLLYAGVAISSLAMFIIVVSEEIDQYMSLQRETARQRAKIAVLQMRPHFIHNTMMSIYYLCDQDPKAAQRVTMDFNTYLRKNFDAIVKDEAIPFSEEPSTPARTSPLSRRSLRASSSWISTRRTPVSACRRLRCSPSRRTP